MIKKALSLLLSGALVGTSGNLAQAGALAPEVFAVPSNLPQFQLIPPGQLGRVADYFNSDVSATRRIGVSAQPPLIILIQDLHAHYGVQKNIAGLLDFLSDKLAGSPSPTRRHADTPHVPFALAVEGASGPVDSSILALYPDKKVKEAASDFLMREGELTGPEYFATKHGIPNLLVGVENEDYYEIHRQLFRKTLQTRQALVSILRNLQEGVSKLPAHLYHGAARDIYKNLKAYDDGQMTLRELVRELQPSARSFGMDIKKEFPELAAFMEGGALAPERLHQLTAEFLTGAQDHLSAEEKKNLAVLAKQKSTASYYLYMRDLVYAHNLFLAIAPELARYLEYTHTAQTMGMDRVTFEARELAYRLKERAAQTQEEKDLALLEHDLGLLVRLADLQATETEVKAFGPRLNQFIVLAQHLTARAGSQPFDEKELRQLLLSSIDFYAMAMMRNGPMIENTLKLITTGESGEQRVNPETSGDAANNGRSKGFRHHRHPAVPGITRLSRIHPPSPALPAVAVLVAGGFHTTFLTQLLREKNISYIVMTPMVDHISERDHDLYIRRLNGEMLSPEGIVQEALATETAWKKGSLEPIANANALDGGIKGAILFAGSIGALVAAAAIVQHSGNHVVAVQQALSQVSSYLGQLSPSVQAVAAKALTAITLAVGTAKVVSARRRLLPAAAFLTGLLGIQASIPFVGEAQQITLGETLPKTQFRLGQKNGYVAILSLRDSPDYQKWQAELRRVKLLGYNEDFVDVLLANARAFRVAGITPRQAAEWLRTALSRPTSTINGQTIERGGFGGGLEILSGFPKSYSIRHQDSLDNKSTGFILNNPNMPLDLLLDFGFAGPLSPSEIKTLFTAQRPSVDEEAETVTHAFGVPGNHTVQVAGSNLTFRSNQGWSIQFTYEDGVDFTVTRRGITFNADSIQIVLTSLQALAANPAVKTQLTPNQFKALTVLIEELDKEPKKAHPLASAPNNIHDIQIQQATVVPVKIVIPTPVKNKAGKKTFVEVSASHITDAISALVSAYPDLKEELLTAGQPRSDIRWALNGTVIEPGTSIGSVSLHANDELSFIRNASGGSGASEPGFVTVTLDGHEDNKDQEFDDLIDPKANVLFDLGGGAFIGVRMHGPDYKTFDLVQVDGAGNALSTTEKGYSIREKVQVGSYSNIDQFVIKGIRDIHMNFQFLSTPEGMRLKVKHLAPGKSASTQIRYQRAIVPKTFDEFKLEQKNQQWKAQTDLDQAVELIGNNPNFTVRIWYDNEKKQFFAQRFSKNGVIRHGNPQQLSDPQNKGIPLGIGQTFNPGYGFGNLQAKIWLSVDSKNQRYAVDYLHLSADQPATLRYVQPLAVRESLEQVDRLEKQANTVSDELSWGLANDMQGLYETFHRYFMTLTSKKDKQFVETAPKTYLDSKRSALERIRAEFREKRTTLSEPEAQLFEQRITNLQDTLKARIEGLNTIAAEAKQYYSKMDTANKKSMAASLDRADIAVARLKDIAMVEEDNFFTDDISGNHHPRGKVLVSILGDAEDLSNRLAAIGTPLTPEAIERQSNAAGDFENEATEIERRLNELFSRWSKGQPRRSIPSNPSDPQRQSLRESVEDLYGDWTDKELGALFSDSGIYHDDLTSYHNTDLTALINQVLREHANLFKLLHDGMVADASVLDPFDQARKALDHNRTAVAKFKAMVKEIERPALTMTPNLFKIVDDKETLSKFRTALGVFQDSWDNIESGYKKAVRSSRPNLLSRRLAFKSEFVDAQIAYAALRMKYKRDNAIPVAFYGLKTSWRTIMTAMASVREFENDLWSGMLDGLRAIAKRTEGTPIGRAAARAVNDLIDARTPDAMAYAVSGILLASREATQVLLDAVESTLGFRTHVGAGAVWNVQGQIDPDANLRMGEAREDFERITGLPNVSIRLLQRTKGASTASTAGPMELSHLIFVTKDEAGAMTVTMPSDAVDLIEQVISKPEGDLGQVGNLRSAFLTVLLHEHMRVSGLSDKEVSDRGFDDLDLPRLARLQPREIALKFLHAMRQGKNGMTDAMLMFQSSPNLSAQADQLFGDFPAITHRPNPWLDFYWLPGFHDMEKRDKALRTLKIIAGANAADYWPIFVKRATEFPAYAEPVLLQGLRWAAPLIHSAQDLDTVMGLLSGIAERAGSRGGASAVFIEGRAHFDDQINSISDLARIGYDLADMVGAKGAKISGYFSTLNGFLAALKFFEKDGLKRWGLLVRLGIAGRAGNGRLLGQYMPMMEPLFQSSNPKWEFWHNRLRDAVETGVPSFFVDWIDAVQMLPMQGHPIPPMSNDQFGPHFKSMESEANDPILQMSEDYKALISPGAAQGLSGVDKEGKQTTRNVNLRLFAARMAMDYIQFGLPVADIVDFVNSSANPVEIMEFLQSSFLGRGNDAAGLILLLRARGQLRASDFANHYMPISGALGPAISVEKLTDEQILRLIQILHNRDLADEAERVQAAFDAENSVHPVPGHFENSRLAWLYNRDRGAHVDVASLFPALDGEPQIPAPSRPKFREVPLLPIPQQFGIPLAYLGDVKDGLMHDNYAVVSPDGDKAVVLRHPEHARQLIDYVDLQTGRVTSEEIADVSMSRPAISPDGQWLAARQYDRNNSDQYAKVVLIDVANMNQPREIGHFINKDSAKQDKPVQALAFIPTQLHKPGARWLVTGSYSSRIYFLDVTDPLNPIRMSGYELSIGGKYADDTVSEFAVSADGKSLIVVMESGAIYHGPLSYTPKGKVLYEYRIIKKGGTFNSVRAVAIDPINKNRFVTANNDGTIQLWDAKSGPKDPVRLIQTNDGDWAESLHFSEDGRYLTVAGMAHFQVFAMDSPSNPQLLLWNFRDAHVVTTAMRSDGSLVVADNQKVSIIPAKQALQPHVTELTYEGKPLDIKVARSTLVTIGTFGDILGSDMHLALNDADPQVEFFAADQNAAFPLAIGEPVFMGEENNHFGQSWVHPNGRQAKITRTGPRTFKVEDLSPDHSTSFSAKADPVQTSFKFWQSVVQTVLGWKIDRPDGTNNEDWLTEAQFRAILASSRAIPGSIRAAAWIDADARIADSHGGNFFTWAWYHIRRVAAIFEGVTALGIGLISAVGAVALVPHGHAAGLLIQLTALSLGSVIAILATKGGFYQMHAWFNPKALENGQGVYAMMDDSASFAAVSSAAMGAILLGLPILAGVFVVGAAWVGFVLYNKHENLNTSRTYSLEGGLRNQTVVQSVLAALIRFGQWLVSLMKQVASLWQNRSARVGIRTLHNFKEQNTRRAMELAPPVGADILNESPQFSAPSHWSTILASFLPYRRQVIVGEAPFNMAA